MTGRNLERRLEKIERARPMVPADVRAWLGENVAPSEIAAAARQPDILKPVTIADHLERWLTDRRSIPETSEPEVGIEKLEARA